MSRPDYSHDLAARLGVLGFACVDSSWGNDTSPSFTIELADGAASIKVYTDAADPADREELDQDRFACWVEFGGVDYFDSTETEEHALNMVCAAIVDLRAAVAAAAAVAAPWGEQ